MSRYDHKIETSLEGIEHLSKEIKRKTIIGFHKSEMIKNEGTKT